MKTSIFQPAPSPETAVPQERRAEHLERAARSAEPSHPDVATQLASATRFGHRLENVALESSARSDQDSRRRLPDDIRSQSDTANTVGQGESGPVQLKKGKKTFRGKKMSLAEFHETEERQEQERQQRIRQGFRDQVAPRLGPAATAFRQRQQHRSDPNRPYLPHDPVLWRRHEGARPTTDRGQMIQYPRNKAHAKFHEDANLPGTFSEFHIADETIGEKKPGRNVYFDVQGGPGHTESRAFAHGPRKTSQSDFHSKQAGQVDRTLRSSLQNEARAQASENVQRGIWRTPQVTPEMPAGMNRQEARDYLRRRGQDEHAVRTANTRRLSQQAYEERKRGQGGRDEDEGAVVGVDPRQVNTPIQGDTNTEDNEAWAAQFQWPNEDSDDM